MSAPRLVVLGRNVEIVISELRHNDGQLGEYDPDAMCVTIDPSADYWPTLLHELMHAAFHRVNFQPGEVAEEMLADVLAAVLCENFHLEHRGSDGEEI